MLAGFETPTEGRILVDGTRRVAPGAPRTRHQHGVPVLRAVPAHDRGPERGVRSAAQEARHGERSNNACRSPCRRCGSRATASGTHASSRAVRRNASRSLERWRTNRRCCCSTSRSAPSTSSSARRCSSSSSASSARSGISFVYVTHDQGEALTMSRSDRRHERWRRGTPRDARGGLPAPGLVVRRGLHRADQLPVRAGGVRRAPTAPRCRSKGDIARGAPGSTRGSRSAPRPWWWFGPSTCASPRRSRRPVTPAVPVTVLDEVFQGSVVRYQLQGPGDLRLVGVGAAGRTRRRPRGRPGVGIVVAGMGLRPAARVRARASSRRPTTTL